VLNSKNFGVPQNRERVFIVGHLRGQPRPEVFPIGTSNTENEPERVLAHTLNSSDWRGARRLTPTECERLQGFPDGFTEGVSDTQRYKTLGNAVTVNVVYEVARRLTLNTTLQTTDTTGFVSVRNK
jgi:DNA (cytosine-5)-methyltransferase 1